MQERDADRSIPNAHARPPTNDLDGARPRQQSEDTTSTPHYHHPPGPKAQALRTRTRCQVPIAQCPTTRAATTNGHNAAPPSPRPPVGGHHQHPRNHRTPGPKALALHARARRRSPKAQPCVRPPPTPTTARNHHRNPGEPTPTPSTALADWNGLLSQLKAGHTLHLLH